ncbi:MAG: glutamine-hydrolyzing GMP synthase, partial [Planctomycetes bacterium]|nr:glutamine-hydrolyzing GMP synthase [Planctomycetota bacterium]
MVETLNKDLILILDFGSQYAQLIARRVRENNVYSRIVPYNVSFEEVESLRPRGIILSGGPASVYQDSAPVCNKGLLELGVPILGICYGMQIGCQLLGAEVRASRGREYGRAHLVITHPSSLLGHIGDGQTVWMSHGDQVSDLPEEFVSLAYTANCPYAVVKHKDRDFYGVQFHPEVSHTPCGSRIIRNFLFEICGCKGDWQMSSYIEKSVEEIRQRVGKDRVVCALSGGVDSTVVASLIYKAIGDQLACIFVDTGLLREGEAWDIKKTFTEFFPLELHIVDARERFLKKLRGVVDPERKRKIIGHEFIAVFKEEALRLRRSGARYLAQGTLYPDVIESIPAHGGPTASIKSHHNVGGLP